eukprot:2179508-Amphidinium_carterae.1
MWRHWQLTSKRYWTSLDLKCLLFAEEFSVLGITVDLAEASEVLKTRWLPRTGSQACMLGAYMRIAGEQPTVIFTDGACENRWASRGVMFRLRCIGPKYFGLQVP